MAGKQHGSAKGERRGGRQKGAKNKATIEREQRALQELAQQAHAAQMSGRKIIMAKDELLDLIPVVKGTVAEFQKAAIDQGNGLPGQAGFSADKWDRFRLWVETFERICHRAAEFQSPKYRAIAVAVQDPGKQQPDPRTVNAVPTDKEGRERYANASYLKLIKG